jgi:hypothetical protein
MLNFALPAEGCISKPRRLDFDVAAGPSMPLQFFGSRRVSAAANHEYALSVSAVPAAVLELIFVMASWAFSIARVTSAISCFRSFSAVGVHFNLPFRRPPQLKDSPPNIQDQSEQSLKRIIALC